jgi:hypothetical protein
MERVIMSLAELIPVLQALPHADKLRLLQFLVFELAQEEGVSLLDPNLTYPIWTPFNAFEAADTLLQALEADQEINGH